MRYHQLRTFLAISLLAFIPVGVFAHENYVLPAQDMKRGMQDWSLNVLDALKDPANVQIGLIVTIGTIIAYALYLWFMASRVGLAFDKKTKRLEPFGHAFLRVALGVSFIASAMFNSFLGPEIPLSSLPLGGILLPFLYAVGVLLVIGLWTELASLVGLIILTLATFVYGEYMLTYVNYFGELIALILYGSRFFSVDRLIIKSPFFASFAKTFEEFEIPLIRITYGFSVLYPAITVKLLHPVIILQIVEQYNLTSIGWLFPSDPLLISFGTGMAQVTVGLFIILGFATRFTSLVTFMLYIMSIIFFQEAVWPHYILLALALYLVVNDGGKWSIDNWLNKRLTNRK